MKRIVRTVLFLSISFITTLSAYSQCNDLAKKKCIPTLKPYLSNGQMNTSELMPGEKTEVDINLNKGLSYRLLICTDSYGENTTYQLSNNSGFVLTNDTMTKEITFKDIQVDRSQTLTLTLQSPEAKNTTTEKSGCVTVLLGFK